MQITQLQSARQDELNALIERGLSNPDIRQALEVFQMSEAEYARALAAMHPAVISTGSTTNINPISNARTSNGKLGRRRARTKKAK